MLVGVSDTEIAKKLKVTRQTVNYWRNQDFDFIYELQMRRNQIWESHRDELIDLYKMAVEEVKKSFKSKDPKIRLQVAMQILRLPALQENLKNKAPTAPLRSAVGYRGASGISPAGMLCDPPSAHALSYEKP